MTDTFGWLYVLMTGKITAIYLRRNIYLTFFLK